MKFENGAEPTANFRSPSRMRLDGQTFHDQLCPLQPVRALFVPIRTQPRRAKVPGQWASNTEVGRKTITL